MHAQQRTFVMTKTRANETKAQLKFNEGLAFHRLGKLAKAKELYRQALTFQPKHHEALHVLGVIAAQSQQYDEAIVLISRSIEIKSSAMAYCNRGNALRDKGNDLAALEDYQRSVHLEPQYASAYFNCGKTWHKLKQYERAVNCFDLALAQRPNDAQIHLNRGIALHFLNQHQAALESYEKATASSPDDASILFNRGISLGKLHRYNEAIESYDQALAKQPDFAEVLVNRGNILQVLKQYDAAIVSYEKALALNPDYPFLYGVCMHSKMNICDWENLTHQREELTRKINCNQTAVPPFVAVSLFGSAQLQHKSAQIWIKARYPSLPELDSIPTHRKHSKIRLGYFSADFHEHATMYLMAELFERHNREKFEIFGFSFGAIHNDSMRVRASAAFDKFLEISQLSDSAIKILSHQLEIDIAIDLKGFTENERAGIFSRRVAPVQVSYLGYPGTMGADYIDYLIADRALIPGEMQPHYAEKIVYLPHSYQVNDTHRKISDKIFTREELALPPSGFVFCCFNNNYKINPETFDCWMRILSRVNNSVLWLLEDNPISANHLRQEALKRTIDPQRLIFTPRMPLPDHLARHRAADLFIDTLPCNAHTTASDALWAGLPVLTCTGEAFASRVAASLLTAVDLPELITTTQEEYEALAVELALNPERLHAIKQKLMRNRLVTPLFDIKLFTKNIESAYMQMYDRHQTGLGPDHIFV